MPVSKTGHIGSSPIPGANANGGIEICIGKVIMALTEEQADRIIQLIRTGVTAQVDKMDGGDSHCVVGQMASAMGIDTNMQKSPIGKHGIKQIIWDMYYGLQSEYGLTIKEIDRMVQINNEEPSLEERRKKLIAYVCKLIE